jgi:hypothetical protein
MKALTWHGKRDVRVDNVPDPTIQESPNSEFYAPAAMSLRLFPGMCPCDYGPASSSRASS